jgi:transposase
VITAGTRAEILRLFHAEHFTVHGIAKALRVHHSTVRRVLAAEPAATTTGRRPRKLDRYLPLIQEKLAEHPTMRATRLFQVLQDLGYDGSVVQLRRGIRGLRPAPPRAFLALTVLPGEQGQADWGHFGTLQVGRAKRKLSCFVLTLSYSRRLFARFTLDQSLESFLRGHVEAFADFGGVPRRVLYDNLKAVVVERLGTAVRFNSAHLEFAGAYHFKPEPCSPAAGWEKGRVEAAIRYIRSSYAAGRTYRDLDDANAQLRRWLDEVANVRPWPGDRSRTVAEAFAEERPTLLPLPVHVPPTAHVRAVRSGKWPLVRFDLNDYSIPHRLVGKPLVLVANETTVRVLDGTEEVARHARSWDRARRIEDRAHFEGLLAHKRRGLPGKASDWLRQLEPEVGTLLKLLAERGENLGSHVAQMVQLVQVYGVDDFAWAVKHAASRGTPRASSVAVLLQAKRHAANTPPPVPVQLPEDPRVRNLRVRRHDPAAYDTLARPPRPKRNRDVDEPR